jgi:hypothetical protein
LALLILGLVLVVGFWPLVSVSGSRLYAARLGNGYVGWPPGAQILIHEKVLNVSYTDFLGNQRTAIQIDTGNPDNQMVIFVDGDARGVAVRGSVIYTTAVLKQVTFLGQSFQYWEIPTPQDIQPSWPVDFAFDGLLVAGVGLLAYVALRRK